MLLYLLPKHLLSKPLLPKPLLPKPHSLNLCSLKRCLCKFNWPWIYLIMNMEDILVFNILHCFSNRNPNSQSFKMNQCESDMLLDIYIIRDLKLHPQSLKLHLQSLKLLLQSLKWTQSLAHLFPELWTWLKTRIEFV